MNNLWDFLTNDTFLVALTAWFVAQALKIPIYYLVEKKWDFHRFYGSGGMPSSHSSMVVATAAMIGTLEGLNSTVFALACVLGAIVMYDASGVRQETGKQAKVINKIIRDFLIEGKELSNQELKEFVGHTRTEVFGGAIVGFLCWLGYYVLFL